MKLTAFAALLLLPLVTLKAGDNWTEDYKAALATAKSGDKMVLLDFTGSDWCGWCIKIDKEIFSKAAFQDFAKENLVLVKLDFPRKVEQSKEIKAQNQKLAEKYGIQGFPTIIVLNSQGEKIGTLGYMEGGPDAFVAALKELQSKS